MKRWGWNVCFSVKMNRQNNFWIPEVIFKPHMFLSELIITLMLLKTLFRALGPVASSVHCAPFEWNLQTDIMSNLKVHHKRTFTQMSFCTAGAEKKGEKSELQAWARIAGLITNKNTNSKWAAGQPCHKRLCVPAPLWKTTALNLLSRSHWVKLRLYRQNEVSLVGTGLMKSSKPSDGVIMKESCVLRATFKHSTGLLAKR